MLENAYSHDPMNSHYQSLLFPISGSHSGTRPWSLVSLGPAISSMGSRHLLAELSRCFRLRIRRVQHGGETTIRQGDEDDKIQRERRCLLGSSTQRATPLLEADDAQTFTHWAVPMLSSMVNVRYGIQVEISEQETPESCVASASHVGLQLGDYRQS